MAIKLNQFHTTPGVGGETPGEGNTTALQSADEGRARRGKIKKKKRVPLDFGVFAVLPENLVEALEHAIAY